MEGDQGALELTSSERSRSTYWIRVMASVIFLSMYREPIISAGSTLININTQTLLLSLLN